MLSSCLQNLAAYDVMRIRQAEYFGGRKEGETNISDNISDQVASDIYKEKETVLYRINPSCYSASKPGGTNVG